MFGIKIKPKSTLHDAAIAKMTNAIFYLFIYFFRLSFLCLKLTSYVLLGLGKNTENMHSARMVETAKPIFKSHYTDKTHRRKKERKSLPSLGFCHSYKHSIYR